MKITLQPIGVIRTPFREAEGVPIQPVFARDAQGTMEVLPRYAAGLKDLKGFERIWLVYLFHRASPARLRVIPFRDRRTRGVFSTRAPCRPNPIGLSCVRLLGIEGSVLRIGGVDVVDGTPLLDIKPYIPRVDSFPRSRAGWFDRGVVGRTRADGRFR